MTHASSSALLGIVQQVQVSPQGELAPAPALAPQAASQAVTAKPLAAAAQLPGAAAGSTGGASGAPGTAPGRGSTEFTAVDPAAAERYDGNTLLVTAYVAIWIVLMGWILLLWRKQASIADRLEGLERTLDRAAATAEQKAIKAKAS